MIPVVNYKHHNVVLVVIYSRCEQKSETVSQGFIDTYYTCIMRIVDVSRCLLCSTMKKVEIIGSLVIFVRAYNVRYRTIIIDI